MFHSTTHAAAVAIKANGFSLAHAGDQGGAEFGTAVYLCPDMEAVEAWESDMRWFGINDVLLAVKFSGNLYDLDATDIAPALFAWADANGLTLNGEPTDAGRAELLAAADANPSYHPANIWIVRMLKEHGFDGLICTNEGNRRQVAVWNVATLSIKE